MKHRHSKDRFLSIAAGFAIVASWYAPSVTQGAPPEAATKAPEATPTAEVETVVSFVNDVVPIFSKFGCNTGSCHGSASGKDGFHLSLFGFNPAGDHTTLMHDLPGRRIDLAMPAESLLLTKATGQVRHTGGKLFETSSPHYQQLLRWINEAATFDGDVATKVTRVEITPSSAVLEGHQSRQPLSVVAHYADKTTRDVTDLAYFSSSDPTVAEVSNDGTVTAKSRGEAFIMARFEAHTVGSPFIVHTNSEPFQWPEAETANYIDTAVNQKLKKLRIVPSETCTDAEFLRRVSIDLRGALPSADQLLEFVADSDPEKRARQIDQFLNDPGFNRIWSMKWAELLKMRSSNRISEKSIWKYSQWLRKNINDGVTIDKILQQLLTATGSTIKNPAANFYGELPNKLKVAEDVAQVFLGMRIQCAQCHNHPFDRWTMDDYYGFVAFFERTKRKRGNDPREWVILTGGGKTVHPTTKQPVKPCFLGGEQPKVGPKDARAVLADWITSPENPYFARNLANMAWAHFFGRGIIDEVDDARVSNPPVNAELLDELAQHLTDYQYDFKSLARDICNSKTYQRSTIPNQTNRTDRANFSHAALRRVRAEVLLDVIAQITETKNDFPALPLGSSATEIADGKTTNHFLKTFGRSTRLTACTCEVSMEPNLSQALHLINGDTVHAKIVKGKLIDRWIKAEASDREIVDRLYLRCLARKPSDDEWAALEQELAQTDGRSKLLKDIFWSLLNSSEFLFNH